MDISLVIQVIGWIASLTAVASYSCSKVRNIRIINCVASAFFITYGILLGAPTLIIGNATLALVHLCYLFSCDKFGNYLARHRAGMWIVFGIYAVAMMGYVAVSTSLNTTELVGTLSAVGFVGGFLMSKERPMRSVCSVFLVGNIIYAAMIFSPQVALTNGVSLAVNLYYLFVKNRSKNTKETIEDLLEEPA